MKVPLDTLGCCPTMLKENQIFQTFSPGAFLTNFSPFYFRSSIMLQLKLFLLLLLWIRSGKSAESTDNIPSAELPLEARNNDNGSQEEEVISTSYVLPNQIFNDGKPYYAGKDPVSGQLDFSAKKTTGIETAANEVYDPNDKVVLAAATPNIHDFLNLPVKYSSSKFVYPLVSSSYANLKYQGSNKNYITNKKPTSAPITPGVNYNSQNYYTVQTTKLLPVPPTAAGSIPSFSTTTGSTTPTTRITTTTSTTTPRTSSVSTSRYTTSTRRPISLTSTTFTPRPTASTTRKKFVPTKKYIPTSTFSTASTQMNFPTVHVLNETIEALKPTESSVSANLRPHTQASIFPVNDTKVTPLEIPAITADPTPFTEPPTKATGPTQSLLTTRIPQLNAGDVYYTVGQKQEKEQKPLHDLKPPMSLDELFNTLAEEESAVVSNYQGNQGIDIQGNLIQPMVPSPPSPFALHEQPQPLSPQSTHPTGSQEQKVIAGSQENYSNEYVSYQVQQPNVMQYRPAPGAINNVVISPGQNSASFVLGSQQQVGTNSFGSVEKEPLFSKETMQYGTVINDNINTVKQSIQSAQQPPHPTTYQLMPTQTNTNFHQPSVSSSNIHGFGLSMLQEAAPEAPSPYQQLPLVGSNMKTKTSNRYQQMTQSGYVHNLPPAPAAGNSGSAQTAHIQQSNAPVQDTKELLVSTNIRFPANDEAPTGPAASGPPAAPVVNGHAQPYSLQQIKNSNPVVFPKNDEVSNEGNSVVEDIQIQKHEVLTMNQHKQKLNFPQLPERVSPVQHMLPPPRFPPSLPNTVELGDASHKRPHPNRQNNPANFNEYTRKPLSGLTRPQIDRNLPNILPQFRPNAKISNGHPPANFNQEPGNIHIPGQGNKRPNTPPQFAHRRQPVTQQNRFPMNRISEYPAGPPNVQRVGGNRRIYQLPPYGGQNAQYIDRMYARRPVSQNIANERHAAKVQNVEAYKTLPDEPLPLPERLAAFEEEDLVINDPPQPVTPKNDLKSANEASLEPVVTLQMLQSQKKSFTLGNEDTGSGEIQVPSPEDDKDDESHRPFSENPALSQNGLYVVYPVKGSSQDNLDSAESKDPLPAIAHIDSPTVSEYQNTPFSVIRDQPQEPILKNKNPQSLQQQTKNNQSSRDKFPYPIEKPDPSYSELSPSRLSGMHVMPRIVNGAQGVVTEAPIAYAYTPTQSQVYKNADATKYSNINLASSVISEIRTDTQTEEGPNSVFDTRGQNLEHNFMAPFYPSVSLSSANNNKPLSGWNIIPLSSTDVSIHEKNKIDRADVNDPNDDIDTTTTKSFEMDSFQPELQGGFKPIYPPGYQIDDEKEDQTQVVNDMPIALASRMDPPRVVTNTSPDSPIQTISTSTTAKPKSSSENPIEDERVSSSTLSLRPTTDANSSTTTTTTPTQKKSIFETSLEALLFGDDEEAARAKKERLEVTKSGPRNIPRMGPRNLKLR